VVVHFLQRVSPWLSEAEEGSFICSLVDDQAMKTALEKLTSPDRMGVKKKTQLKEGTLIIILAFMDCLAMANS